MTPTVIDLDKLRDEAHAWLADQPPNRALCPCAIDYFRKRFCLPTWLVDAVERDERKGNV